MYVTALIGFVCCFLVRTGADIRRMQVPSPVMGLLMAGIWISWFAVNDLDRFTYGPMPWLKIAGWVMLAAGTAILAAGVIGLASVKFGQKGLTTAFVFSKLRHPMYYGMILWLAGYPFFKGSVSGHVLSVAGITGVWIWRHMEEKLLIEQYPAYRDYKERSWF